MARTPIPIPAPRPADFPVEGCESECFGVDVDVEIGIEEEMVVEAGLEKVDCEFAAAWFTVDDVDDLLDKVLAVVELDAPSVATRKNRLSIAQHASEVMSPQHQCPSVAHCDNVAVPFADPFSYFVISPTPPYLSISLKVKLTLSFVQIPFKQNGLFHVGSVHISRQYRPGILLQSSAVLHGLWHSPFARQVSGKASRFVAQHMESIPEINTHGWKSSSSGLREPSGL